MVMSACAGACSATDEVALTRHSVDCCGGAADQLAAALRLAALDGDRYAVDRQGVVAGDDLVDAVRLAAGVGEWAVDFIAQAGDCLAPDVVVG